MDIEFIFGIGGITAIVVFLIGLPATYGVLLRQDANADWKKLPVILRFFYEVDLNKDRDERGWFSKHPEIFTLGVILLFCSSLGWQPLLSVFEVNEQTGELQIDTSDANLAIAAVWPIFWWVVFTFGTEWWLKRKWLPKHVIRDKTSIQEIVDRNA